MGFEGGPRGTWRARRATATRTLAHFARRGAPTGDNNLSQTKIPTFHFQDSLPRLPMLPHHLAAPIAFSFARTVRSNRLAVAYSMLLR